MAGQSKKKSRKKTIPANTSLASWTASLTAKQREKLLGGLSETDLETLRWDWRFWGRPSQFAPAGKWRTWLLLSGRGFGKTRAGSEWIRQRVWEEGARRVILMAKTPAEARDVMLNAPEAGLLHVGPPEQRPVYQPSNRLIVWPNGAIGHVRSGAEPEGVRGLEGDTGWLDEFAAWEYPKKSWDLVSHCFRKGDPKVCISTTPKPLAILKAIMARPTTVLTRGSTFDNIGNLSVEGVEEIKARFEGTALGLQELYGEIVEQADGALWRRDMFKRRDEVPPNLRQIVVAIDPAVTAHEESNETGIIAAGVDRNQAGYVLRDRSGRLSPKQWARRAVDLYYELEANEIVAENNQGGDMVKHTIHTEDPNVPVRMVRASKAKEARAQPVAALYEQGRVYHVGQYEELESQLCTWEPGNDSPDRLDALVWAFHRLVLGRPAPILSVDAGITDENYWSI